MEAGRHGERERGRQGKRREKETERGREGKGKKERLRAPWAVLPTTPWAAPPTSCRPPPTPWPFPPGIYVLGGSADPLDGAPTSWEHPPTLKLCGRSGRLCRPGSADFLIGFPPIVRGVAGAMSSLAGLRRPDGVVGSADLQHPRGGPHAAPPGDPGRSCRRGPPRCLGCAANSGSGAGGGAGSGAGGGAGSSAGAGRHPEVDRPPPACIGWAAAPPRRVVPGAVQSLPYVPGLQAACLGWLGNSTCHTHILAEI